MDNKDKNIELRSEEVQEIMGQFPSWILRCGISTIAIILLVLIVGSFFFYYPDTITVPVTLTTSKPPVEVYTQSSGRLDSILKYNGQKVKANETLAIIDNSANYNDIKDVHVLLNKYWIGTRNKMALYSKLRNKEWALGDVESSYCTFIRTLHDYINLYKANNVSLNDKAILELNNAKSLLIVSIINWERRYLIQSPINGFVNTTGNWTINMNVLDQQLILVIIPYSFSESLGTAMLPSKFFGKVKVGQKVKVKLGNDDFGYMPGKIKSISSVPNKDGNYYIVIKFPSGLYTNNGNLIPNKKMLIGTAQIIIGEKRLLENFVEPIKNIINI